MATVSQKVLKVRVSSIPSFTYLQKMDTAYQAGSAELFIWIIVTWEKGS